MSLNLHKKIWGYKEEHTCGKLSEFRVDSHFAQLQEPGENSNQLPLTKEKVEKMSEKKH